MLNSVTGLSNMFSLEGTGNRPRLEMMILTKSIGS
jgi:hypothetical protein